MALREMLDVSTPSPVPELLMVPFLNVKFVTPVPEIPLPDVLWMFMFVNDGLMVLMSEMPVPVVFWIVPPELSPPTDEFALPLTVRPPLEPVVLRTIPFAAPFAAMLLKLRPLAPIVVFATFSAVPVVVASVLADRVTLTVPPPVAVNAGLAPVESETPPVRLIVAPVFEVRLMPLPLPPLSVIWPERAIVPPDLPVTLTAKPLPV